MDMDEIACCPENFCTGYLNSKEVWVPGFSCHADEHDLVSTGSNQDTPRPSPGSPGFQVILSFITVELLTNEINVITMRIYSRLLEGIVVAT